MKSMSVRVLATSRRFRKVFSANGHPQWRRKAITLGLPSLSCSLAVDGAALPILGASAVVVAVGEDQDDSSCQNVILQEVVVDLLKAIGSVQAQLDIWVPRSNPGLLLRCCDCGWRRVRYLDCEQSSCAVWKTCV